MDNFCNLADFVAFGINQRIHDGRGYSYPADYCRYRVSGTTSSREKNIVASWAFARRVKYFKITSAIMLNNILPEVRIPLVRKGILINHSTTQLA